MRPYSPDRLEVSHVSLHHVVRVDVIEQVDVPSFRLGEQPCRQSVFVDYYFFIDVLSAVDHVGGLQPPFVQPAQVCAQQLLQVVERQSSLGIGRKSARHELHSIFDFVDRPRGHGVKATGFTTNC